MAFTFDATYYLQSYTDVASAISRGLFASAEAHFNAHGAKELRNPNSDFNAAYYAAQNQDVLTAVNKGQIASVYAHFLANGAKENRAPNSSLATFDSAAYLAANADVQAAVTAGTVPSALDHYLRFGRTEIASGARTSTGAPANTTTGSTYTLTAGLNAFTGTAGNDSFESLTDGHLTLDDNLNGGAGTDTLLVRALASNTGAFTSQAIENIDVRTAAGGGTVDLTKATGYTSLKANSLAGDLTFSAITHSNSLALAVSDVTANITGVTFTYTDKQLAGTTDTVKLALSGNTDSFNLSINDAGTGGAIETLEISGTTANTGTVTLQNDALAATTVKFTNTAAVLVAGGLTGTTINASGATGAVTVALGAADQSVTGGSGNDNFNFGANLTVADTVDGGTGTDTLTISTTTGTVLSNTGNVKNVKNVETLALSAALTGGTTIDMAQISGLTNLSTSGDGGQTLTVTNILNNATVTFDGADYTSTTTLSLASNTTADVLTIAVKQDISGDLDTGNAFLNTLNIATSGTVDGGDHRIDMGGVSVNKIVVTGDQALDLSNEALSTSVSSVDASAMTAYIKVQASTTSTEIVGGTGADSILGGSGADILTGGAGADTIAGNAGLDTITLTESTSSADTVAFSHSGAVNVDTITGFTSGTDIIAFSIGNIVDNGGANDTLSTMQGTDVGAAGAATVATVTVNTNATLANATNLLFFSNTSATSFATAIGTATLVDTAGGNTAGLSATEGVAAVYYDATNGRAVFGYIEDTTANGTALTSADTFHEVARVTMTAADYTLANITASFAFF